VADPVSVFEFAAFVAGVAVGAVAARLVDLLPRITAWFDELWRNLT
jgi:uncharacterized membrane-anchored protein YhcB (DUF1043 family)